MESNSMAQQASQQLSSKMRLEFLVPAEECDLATDAIESMNAEATVYESESCGCKKSRHSMTVNKGTDTMAIKKPKKRTIVSIVDADKADSMVAAVASAVREGMSSVVKSPVYGVQML